MCAFNVVKAELAAVGVRPEQFPAEGMAEFAFVGKSNVGKSSLINAMAYRKNLARASQNPGKTRTVNFFNINDVLYFVDLPGYGYAKVSRSESNKWGKMAESYLKNRRSLKRIIFLLDIRHEPSANDKLMFDWLRYFDMNIILVATKSDKLKRGAVAGNVSQIRKTLLLGTGDDIIPFSTQTHDGRDKLWKIIESDIVMTDAYTDLIQ